MTVLKCKMCGGNLMIAEGATVCECEYCGTKQTVPKLDDEKKAKLFERAGRLLFNCEFDKAAGIFEDIVGDYPEEAEGYWGLVLCRYGIEYVDDPATGNKIPTCHRSSFDSIMDDADFEMVMENADAVSRAVYREEAKYIEEIRKGIIEVSGKEEPYDIFICYKETAADGERTIDSVLAQDVYEELTEIGYRVFFSRITLEDKLGVEYEPYIFAALNSAKLMLAFGTSYDYYNAVWVKNEWSRFLKLMAKDRSKHLIPCYKNLDAYDIPKEFKHLQAQDMGKVGAMQDLIRGIKKIIVKEEPKVEVKQSPSIVTVRENYQSNGSNVYSIEKMVENAETFMKLGEYSRAGKIYKEITNKYPEDYRGWWGIIRFYTKDFTVDNISFFADADVREVNLCFEYVKKLATSEVFEEKKKIYLPYWKMISGTKLPLERQNVEAIKQRYEKQKKEKNDIINTIRKRLREEQNKLEQRVKYHTDDISNMEELISAQRGKIEHANKIFKIGMIITVVSFVLFLVFKALLTDDNYYIMGGNLQLSGICLVGGIITAIYGTFTKRKETTINKKLYEQYSETIDHNKKEISQIEKQKTQTKNEFDRAIKPIEEEISVLQTKIDECDNYKNQSDEDISKLLYSIDCQRFDEEVSYDNELLLLREKVFAMNTKNYN